MKTKLCSLFIFITIILLITSCGSDKKSYSGKVSFNLSNLVTGTFPSNGLILNAKNGGQRIQVALSNPAQDIELEVSEGSWTFWAVAWVPVDGVLKKMSGEARCGKTVKSISGGDFDININLSRAGCTDSAFGNNSRGASPNLNRIILKPCLNFNGVNFSQATQYCHSDWTKKGVSSSFRIRYFNYNSFDGSHSTGLNSSCVSATAANNGMTDLRLPLQSSQGLFPFIIEGFENSDCSGQREAVYRVSFGLQEIEKGIDINPVISENINGHYDFFIADNYVGHGTSALVNQAPVDISKCGGSSCFPQENSISNNNGGDTAYEVFRNSVYDVLGSPSGVHPREGLFYNSSTIEDSTGKPLVIIYEVNEAPTISPTIIINDDDSSVPSITETTSSLSINADFDGSVPGSRTVQDIITAVNSSTNFKAIKAGFVSDSEVVDPIVSTYTMSGFMLPNSQDYRDRGVLADVAMLLAGPAGALLAKGGISSCSAIPDGGSYSISLPDDPTIYTFSFSSGSITIPSVFGADISTFEKRLTFTSSNNEENMVYEFNCSDVTGADDRKMGMFSRREAEGSEVEISEVYYYVESDSLARVEIYDYNDGHEESGVTYTNRNIISFEKSSVDSIKVWHGHYSIDSNNDEYYSKIFGTSDLSLNEVEVRSLSSFDIDSDSILQIDETNGLFNTSAIGGSDEFLIEDRKFSLSTYEEILPQSSSFVTEYAVGNITLDNWGSGSPFERGHLKVLEDYLNIHTP